MAKRTLKNLNLLDDFLFGTLVSHKEFGEAFCRELLQTIFQRKFGKLKVIPQRQYYGDDTGNHGTRLDVYLEEDSVELEPEALYDLEAENAKDKNKRQNLPKRARFYRAIVDGHSLASGEDYGTLKDVYIIIILPYDPFDRDRLIYTIRNMCQEDPSMPYEDGARTIFLYTKGKKGNISKELQELLHYMEDTENGRKSKRRQGGASGIYEGLGKRTDDPGRRYGGWNCSWQSRAGERNRKRTSEGRESRKRSGRTQGKT